MSANKEPRYEFLDPPEKEGEIGRLGPYRVTGMLGQGGMGQVFHEDGRLKRSVALKVMNKKFAATPNSRKRFVEEARSMAAVHHDNVATIFEVGVRAGTPFMAMEMLKGKTLAAWNAEGKRYAPEKIFQLAKEVAAGLAAAHACGIIHRDVKPANIWIEEPSGRAKILDFGLALAGVSVDRFSRRGSVVGTPGYLAPEQARNEPLDDRTDLYSLGVVLYQMCVGKLPLTSDSIPGQLIAIIAHHPKPLREIDSDIPEPLAELIDRLLSKEPRDRPKSASHLEQLVVEAAERCRGESQVALQIVTASPTTPAKSSSPDSSHAPRRKSPLPWILSASVLFVAVLIVWQFNRPKRIARRPTPVVNPTPSSQQKAFVVSATSLKPLRLTEVTAGSARVKSGDAARFQMQIENNAADNQSDPRRVNSKARVAAQVVTYLQTKGGMKRKAPPFPKKFSPSQLPRQGQSQKVEIQFITSNLLPEDYEVIFELQSPTGELISSTTTKLTIRENLGVAELLGFELLRTHSGGADTYVANHTSEDLGSKPMISIHRHGGGEKRVDQHAYLKFDLSKSPVPKAEIDRAILLLTVDKNGHPSTSTINVYGVTSGLPDDWAEKGEAHLTWEQAPSRAGVQSLKYLTQVKIDNGADALKDRVDGVRIYGTNLDDYLRNSPSEMATIVLIRESGAEKPTNFSAKEGKPQQAPALALRRR